MSLFHELVHTEHIMTGTFLGRGEDRTVTSETAKGADRVDLKEHGGAVVPLEEYKTVGLPPYQKEAFTDRKYRAERRQLGEDVPDRLYYTLKTARGEPWL